MFTRIAFSIAVLSLVIVNAGCGPKDSSGNTSELPVQPSSKDAYRIEVTADGFTPSQISVPAGQDTVIEFVRTAETTCATKVVFKSGERHDLPLNSSVSVTVHPATGEKIQFSCPMDMFHGSIVATDSPKAIP